MNRDCCNAPSLSLLCHVDNNHGSLFIYRLVHKRNCCFAMHFSQPDTDVSLSPVICSPAASAASTRRTHHDVKQPPWPRPPPPLSYSWREVGSSRRSRGLQAEHRSGATTAQRRGKGMGMDSVAAYWSHTTLQKVSQNKSLQKMSADNLGADHECIE